MYYFPGKEAHGDDLVDLDIQVSSKYCHITDEAQSMSQIVSCSLTLSTSSFTSTHSNGIELLHS